MLSQNVRGRGRMPTSIAGKPIVVTGASKGISKGIARVSARNGAKVTMGAWHRAAAKAPAKELWWLLLRVMIS